MFRILVLALAVFAFTSAYFKDDPWNTGTQICCPPDNFEIHYDLEFNSQYYTGSHKLSIYRKKTENLLRVDWDDNKDVIIGFGTDQQKAYAMVGTNGEESCFAHHGDDGDSEDSHCVKDGVLTVDATAATTMTVNDAEIDVQPYTYSVTVPWNSGPETGTFVITVPDSVNTCLLVEMTGDGFSKVATSYSTDVLDASVFDVSACAEEVPAVETGELTQRRRKREILKRMPLF